MPLIDILADLAADQGFRVDVNSQRERVISLVNDAAFELFTHNDLENCLWEQVYSIGTTDQLVYLPWYVEDPKACRRYLNRQGVDLVDMRPRYATMGWRDDYYNNFRLKKRNAALKRSIINDTKVTISLPAGEVNPEAFTVTIVGKTAQSARAVETIVFAVGDVGSKTSVNLYTEDIELIRKNIKTTLDLTFTDGEGNEIAELPNHLLQTQYTLLQVLDRNLQYGTDLLVEILYKVKFIPFSDDYDNFVCGSDYDKAIYYKAVSLYKAKFDDQASLNLAIAYDGKCNDVITRYAKNKQGPIRQTIDFGPNRWRQFTRAGNRVSSITGLNVGRF